MKKTKKAIEKRFVLTVLCICASVVFGGFFSISAPVSVLAEQEASSVLSESEKTEHSGIIDLPDETVATDDGGEGQEGDKVLQRKGRSKKHRPYFR